MDKLQVAVSPSVSVWAATYSDVIKDPLQLKPAKEALEEMCRSCLRKALVELYVPLGSVDQELLTPGSSGMYGNGSWDLPK